MSIPGLSLGPVNMFQITNMPMDFLGDPPSGQKNEPKNSQISGKNTHLETEM